MSKANLTILLLLCVIAQSRRLPISPSCWEKGARGFSRLAPCAILLKTCASLCTNLTGTIRPRKHLTMRRIAILFIIFVVLIGAGFLSITLSQSTSTPLPGMRVQTTNPDASVLVATPQKGALLIGLAIVTIGVIGGLGTGIALLFQILSRQIDTVEHKANEPLTFDIRTTRPRSMGHLLTRTPALTVAIALIVLFLLAIGAVSVGLLI